MSVNPPKNTEVYIVIAIASLGGFFVNSSNVGITDDKVSSIEQRLEDLETEIKELRNVQSAHEALFAHAGIDERTEQQQDQLASIDERIKYLERLMLDWRYQSMKQP